MEQRSQVFTPETPDLPQIEVSRLESTIPDSRLKGLSRRSTTHQSESKHSSFGMMGRLSGNHSSKRVKLANICVNTSKFATRDSAVRLGSNFPSVVGLKATEKSSLSRINSTLAFNVVSTQNIIKEEPILHLRRTRKDIFREYGQAASTKKWKVKMKAFYRRLRITKTDSNAYKQKMKQKAMEDKVAAALALSGPKDHWSLLKVQKNSSKICAYT